LFKNEKISRIKKRRSKQ